MNSQERLNDLIGPYWGTYGTVCRVIQPSTFVGQAETKEKRPETSSAEREEPAAARNIAAAGEVFVGG